MSGAYKCDRCGEYGDTPTATVHMNIEALYKGGMAPNGQQDLCRDCAESLKEWYE